MINTLDQVYIRRLHEAHERTKLRMRKKRLAKLHGKRPRIRQGKIQIAGRP